MWKKSKFFFSLIEIMVVLVIIAIASTVVGIKISKSISDHEYQRATEQIFEKLMFAKKLALANQCDVYLSLIQENNKLYSEVGYFGGSDGKNQKKYRHGFSNLKFKFESEDQGTVENSITFCFTSSGDYLPRGILYLSRSDKSKKDEPIKIDFKDLFLREVVNK
jgi:prepilin-type N-terminal cleavage/methylation domain-containing protein